MDFVFHSITSSICPPRNGSLQAVYCGAKTSAVYRKSNQLVCENEPEKAEGNNSPFKMNL